MLRRFSRLLLLAACAVVLTAGSFFVNPLSTTMVDAQQPNQTNKVFIPISSGQSRTQSVMGIIPHLDSNPVWKTRLDESGVTWVRVFSYWATMEPSPGVYDFSAYDALIKQYADSGYRVLLNVDSAPAFYANPQCGPLNANAIEQYKKFLTALVQRYSGAPYFVNHIALYNEADTYYNGPSTGIGACWGSDWQAYGEMLERIYPVIKAANPTVQVVLGPVAHDLYADGPGSNQGHARNWTENLVRFDPDGAGSTYGPGYYADFFDILAFNAYIDFRGDPDYASRGNGILGKNQYMRDLMKSVGKPKPIFVAETGLSEGPNSGVGSNPPRSEDDQARFAVQVMTQYQADWLKGIGQPDRLVGAVYFLLRDLDALDAQGNQAGLVKSDGTPKQSFQAFRQVSKQLTGLSLIADNSDPTFGANVPPAPAVPCSPGGGLTGPYYCRAVQKYVFGGFGTQKWVLWTDPGNSRNYDRTTTYQYTLPGTPIKVEDIYGNVLPNTNVVTISSSPLFITFAG